MKLWIDDIRPAPKGYVWVKTVNDAKLIIEMKESNALWFSDRIYELENIFKFDLAKNLKMALDNSIIELIDMDHDAGIFASDGGDYIKLLDWLEETKRNNYPIRIHSMNPVGVENMRRIIKKNNWTEIK